MLFAAAPAVPGAADDDFRVVRVEQWLKSVLHHEPGETDEALRTVQAWTNADLRTLWIDLEVLARLMRNPNSARFSLQIEGERRPREIRYTSPQLRRLVLLACAAAGTLGRDECTSVRAAGDLDDDLRALARRSAAARSADDTNDVLRRGALLHADVPILLPTREVEPIGGGRQPGPQRVWINMNDGREVDIGLIAVHWEIARMLLDHVTRPSSDRARSRRVRATSPDRDTP
jgi:hypothetical protein